MKSKSSSSKITAAKQTCNLIYITIIQKAQGPGPARLCFKSTMSYRPTHACLILSRKIMGLMCSPFQPFHLFYLSFSNKMTNILDIYNWYYSLPTPFPHTIQIIPSIFHVGYYTIFSTLICCHQLKHMVGWVCMKIVHFQNSSSWVVVSINSIFLVK